MNRRTFMKAAAASAAAFSLHARAAEPAQPIVRYPDPAVEIFGRDEKHLERAERKPPDQERGTYELVEER